MKYLLVLAVVLIAFHIWRSNRRTRVRDAQDEPQRRTPAGAPEAMARCAHCGLHLPRSQALAGRGGSHYCSDAHRRQAEG